MEGGIAKSEAGVGGSASITTIDTDTIAFIGGVSDVTADGSIVIAARDEFDIISIAGAIGIGKKVGVGVSTSDLIRTNNVLAYVGNNSTVNARANQSSVQIDTGDEDNDGDEITISFGGLAVTAVFL